MYLLVKINSDVINMHGTTIKTVSLLLDCLILMMKAL
jgi:hypothetical protein